MRRHLALVGIIVAVVLAAAPAVADRDDDRATGRHERGCSPARPDEDGRGPERDEGPDKPPHGDCNNGGGNDADGCDDNEGRSRRCRDNAKTKDKGCGGRRCERDREDEGGEDTSPTTSTSTTTTSTSTTTSTTTTSVPGPTTTVPGPTTTVPGPTTTTLAPTTTVPTTTPAAAVSQEVATTPTTARPEAVGGAILEREAERATEVGSVIVERTPAPRAQAEIERPPLAATGFGLVDLVLAGLLSVGVGVALGRRR